MIKIHLKLSTIKITDCAQIVNGFNYISAACCSISLKYGCVLDTQRLPNCWICTFAHYGLAIKA